MVGTGDAPNSHSHQLLLLHLLQNGHVLGGQHTSKGLLPMLDEDFHPHDDEITIPRN